MSAIASIAVSDGEATPVTHTFDPLRIDGDVAYYVNRAPGYAVGFERLSLSVAPPTKQSRLYKVRLRAGFPVMEVPVTATYSGIAPAPSKAFEHGFDLVLFCPERGTLQQRKNMRYLLGNVLVNSQIISAIDSLANVW